MKNPLFAILVLVLALPALVWAADNRSIKPGKGEITVLVGETFSIDAGPGASCKLPEFAFPLGRPDEKATDCTFTAVNRGEVEVTILKPVPRTVKVKAVPANELTRVKIGDLTKDPGKFGDGLIMIEGENRGWGAPAKAKEVWGEHHTRSDWILEDDTGATYITGLMKPGFKFARAVVVARKWQGKWALQAVRLEEAEVVLKPDVVNELRVGQTAVIMAYPSKSHIPEVRVKGEAVKLEKDERDFFVLRAVAEGEAEAELYMHWWNSNIGLGNGDENKPEAVFKIKVVP